MKRRIEMKLRVKMNSGHADFQSAWTVEIDQATFHLTVSYKLVDF
jgi:hypothetical protein